MMTGSGSITSDRRGGESLLGRLLLLLLILASSTREAFAWMSAATNNNVQLLHYATMNTQLSATEEQQGSDDTSDTKYSGYNVLGTELSCCCSNVGNSGIGTGFYRNGFCSTGDNDVGRHTVCVRVTDDFLRYSESVGNDLSTPMPEYHFPGLKEGDIWCLCAQRWAQAYNAGKAPKLFLQSTHEKTLDFIPLEIMRIFAIDGDESTAVINKLNLQRSQLNEMMQREVDEDNESFQ